MSILDPKSEDIKLIVFGAPRTGTTVASQIARELLPGQVQSTHMMIHSKSEEWENAKMTPEESLLYSEKMFWKTSWASEIPAIVTIRCLFDAYCSYADVKHNELTLSDVVGSRATVIGLDKFFNFHANATAVYAQQALFGRKILVLRYEDYFGNETEYKRAKIISQFLGIEKSEKELKDIGLKFSLNKNAERASTFEHFGEYCLETGIHGNHINLETRGRSGQGITRIPEELRKAFYHKYTRFFIMLGYGMNGICFNTPTNKWLEPRQ